MRNTFAALLIALCLCGASAHAATSYYVSAAGNDANSGTSPGQPFRTPGRAIDAMSDGDSVFLRAGDTFTLDSHLRVSRSGTSSRPVVIGAYRRTSGGAIEHRVSGNRPALDGKTTVPTRGNYIGLIHVTGRHVEIRDLVVKNSGGIGIRFHETRNGMVENVRTDWTYRFGIQFFRSRDMEMHDCEIRSYGHGGKFFGEPTFPNGASIRSSSNVLVRGCRVYEGWGEGINTFYGSSNVVIENNTVYAVRNIGIYVDSTVNAIVRNNVVLGTRNDLYHRYGDNTFVGPGIAINNERYQFARSVGGTGGSSALGLESIARDVQIYNNLVAGTAIGMAFFGQLDSTKYRNFVVAHNTFVDNQSQISSPGGHDFEDSLIANNIFLSLSGDASDVGGAINSSGVEFRSNYWSQGAPRSSMRGAGDIHSGLRLRKMSGWRNIRSYSDVSPEDFLPTAGDDSVSSVAGASSLRLSGGPSRDFFGNERETPVDLGAISLTGGQNGPRPPVILSVQ